MSAEPKRVSFMTMDTSSDFLKKPEKDTNSGSNKNKSLRIDLEIFEPDEYKFPEYNYKKLIYIEKKKQKKLAKLPNGLHTPNDDPLGAAEDDDVARIAREMEAKYGTGSSYGKSSRMEFDRGIGYDDNDSFIDNSEAYDEQIPEDVETVRGGFYINSGLLEFKKTPNFERPGDEIRMPKAKKRALSTSSESSESERENDKQQNKVATPDKPKKKKTHSEKKLKSATSSSDEQGKAAKKMKKEKQEKVAQPKVESAPPLPPPAKEVVVVEKEKKKFTEKESTDDIKKVIKTTTVKDMLRAKRDNLRKLEQGKSSGGTTTTTDDDDGSESVSSLAGSESSHEGTHEDTPMNGSTVAKELSFPSNFSAELVQLITNLKQYAESTAKNNSNFFDNHVKEQLIKVDSVAKSHSTQVRVQVYHQLETFIPCTRKTILAKVSRYRIQQADSKVKVEIKKLKTFINTTMPDLVRKYDEDYKTYENLKNIQHVVGDNSMEQKVPRKKYHWNDSSRQILSDIVQLIQELYKVSKVKKETIDEYTSKYLKDHLVPLWPEGWIKLEDFTKELERKKKKDAKVAAASQGANPSGNATNGKQSITHSQQPAYTKTDVRTKIEVDINSQPQPTVNGKSSVVPGTQLSPQQQGSVIKKASDHSINSIMSSSPSPPIHSTKSTPTPVQMETAKTRVIDLDKLSSPNDLLKVSQKDINRSIPKYSQHQAIEVSPDKIRISDGSDSDCAIIDSPIKTTIKPQQQQQQQYPHHMNNNKLNHSSMQQHQHLEMKKTKKHDDNYSNLIKNIASLTDPKKNNSSFLSNPLSTSLNEQRKMDTSHVVNGTATNEHFVDAPKTSKGYNNNLHYSINELIVNTSNTNRSEIVKGNKSSDYQKPYTNANNNNNNSNNASLVHNISVITSTNDAGKSSYAMPPVLNLSNKK